MVLTYLLATSVSEDAGFSTKATVLSILDDLKSKQRRKQKKTSADKGYYLLTLERMKSPDKSKANAACCYPARCTDRFDDNELLHF
jgi:hypothetical protein